MMCLTHSGARQAGSGTSRGTCTTSQSPCTKQPYALAPCCVRYSGLSHPTLPPSPLPPSHLLHTTVPPSPLHSFHLLHTASQPSAPLPPAPHYSTSEPSALLPPAPHCLPALCIPPTCSTLPPSFRLVSPPSTASFPPHAATCPPRKPANLLHATLVETSGGPRAQAHEPLSSLNTICTGLLLQLWRNPMLHPGDDSMAEAHGRMSKVWIGKECIGTVARISTEGVCVSATHVFVADGRFLTARMPSAERCA